MNGGAQYVHQESARAQVLTLTKIGLMFQLIGVSVVLAED